MVDMSYTRIKTPGRQRGLSTSSDILEAGPGKRYPKLFLLLSVLLLVCMISWIPTIAEKSKGPLAFVWPPDQTRDTKLLVHPMSRIPLISPQVCNPRDPTSFPYLLVVVCSAVGNVEARTAIRNSWGLEQNKLKSVRVVFLVGELVNSTHQQELQQEANQYGDILQERFIDTYANLTVKSVMLLKWFNNTCDISTKLRTEYVLKTDDDVYVNLPKLYDLVRANQKPALLMGTLICNAVPIKDPHNKWFVPRYMFNEKKYPNYLSGTGYVMGREAAVRLYAAALATPLFHLEDIYVTGILSRKVGIRPVDNIGFSYVKRILKPCLFLQTVTAHQVGHTEMVDMYGKLQQTKSSQCPPVKLKNLRSYGPGRCTWPKP